MDIFDYLWKIFEFITYGTLILVCIIGIYLNYKSEIISRYDINNYETQPFFPEYVASIMGACITENKTLQDQPRCKLFANENNILIFDIDNQSNKINIPINKITNISHLHEKKTKSDMLGSPLLWRTYTNTYNFIKISYYNDNTLEEFLFSLDHDSECKKYNEISATHNDFLAYVNNQIQRHQDNQNK